MCPSSENYKRDYKAEGEYESSTTQKAKRASRGRARYELMKKGKVRLGDGMDVDHKDGSAMNNDSSNWKVATKKANRSYPRNKHAGKLHKTA
jgi:hypothetical protein